MYKYFPVLLATGKQSRIFLISEYGTGGQCLKNLCPVGYWGSTTTEIFEHNNPQEQQSI
jgi:hypothetical protein